MDMNLDRDMDMDADMDNDTDMDMEIDELRDEISDIDAQIAELYEQRLEAVRNVGVYKKKKDMDVKNSAVEAEKMNTLTSMAEPENAQHIEDLFEFIFAESCRIQEDIIEG